MVEVSQLHCYGSSILVSGVLTVVLFSEFPYKLDDCHFGLLALGLDVDIILNGLLTFDNDRNFFLFTL